MAIEPLCYCVTYLVKRTSIFSTLGHAAEHLNIPHNTHKLALGLTMNENLSISQINLVKRTECIDIM